MIIKASHFPNVARLYPDAKITGITKIYIPEGTPGLGEDFTPGWNLFRSINHDILWRVQFARNIKATSLVMEITNKDNTVEYSEYNINELN